MTTARQPSELDDYLFDLRGYLILRDAIDPDLVRRLNASFDEFPQDLESWDWWGNTQRSDSVRASPVRRFLATSRRWLRSGIRW